MRRAAHAFAFVALAAMALQFPSLAQSFAWGQTIHGPANAPALLGDGHTVTRAVALDASGNVLVAGTSGAASTGDFLTTKLSAATGAILWQKTFGGTPGAGRAATAIAVDVSGNAVVAGLIQNASGNSDIAVVKHAAADGAILWQKTFDAGGYDGAYVVAVDPAGNAVVGAESTNTAGNVDVRILKLAATTGAVMWDRILDNGLDDYVTDLAIDPSGNVVAAGVSANAAGNNDFAIFKCDGATGAVLWRRQYDFGGVDQAYSLALDAAGNAFIAGFATSASADFKTLKLAAADGSIAWQQTFDGGNLDYGQAVAVDGAGNAIVTGYSLNAAGNFDMRTIKYAAASGAVLWQRSFDGGSNDYAYAIAMDPAGNAIVVGSSAAGGFPDWKAIVYASTDGSVLFQRSYAGTAGDADEAFAIAASAGGIAIAGSATEAGSAAGLRVEMLNSAASAASITSPANASALPGATVTFQWNNAGASLYQLWLGNSVGTYDIGYFPTRGTTTTSTVASGIPTDGRKVYARLFSNIGGTYVFRDFTFTASGSGATTSPAGPASITSPANESTLSGASVTFQWNNAGASLYQLWVGNAVGGYDVGYYPATGTAGTSVAATGLPTDGRKLYVRLHSAVNGAWQYRDFSYTAAGSSASAPAAPSPASLASPANGSTLSGSSVTFQWNDAGASLYQVWVGTSPGAYDIGYFPTRGTTATSTVAFGLPTDGRTLYVRLYSALGGAWTFRDYTFRSGP